MGKIVLSGINTIRQFVEVAGEQPLGAKTFVTRETYFAGDLADGEALTIKLGADAGKGASITLTAKLVAAPPAPVK